VSRLAGTLLHAAGGGIGAPLLHAANEGAVSWYEQTQAVFAGVGADPVALFAAGLDQVSPPAAMPKLAHALPDNRRQRTDVCQKLGTVTICNWHSSPSRC